VGLQGVLPGQAAVPHYCVAVHLYQASGLADAAPLVQVLQHRDGLVLGQMGSE
jgi:hypothetical protein